MTDKPIQPGDEVEMWRDGRLLGVHIVQFVYPNGKSYMSAAMRGNHRCPHVERHVITLADSDA